MNTRTRDFVSQGRGAHGTVTRFDIVDCEVLESRRHARLTLRLEWQIVEDQVAPGAAAALWRASFTAHRAGVVTTLAAQDVAAAQIVPHRPTGRVLRFEVELTVEVALEPPPELEATIREAAQKAFRSPAHDMLGYVEAPRIAPGLAAQLPPQAQEWLKHSGLLDDGGDRFLGAGSAGLDHFEIVSIEPASASSATPARPRAGPTAAAAAPQAPLPRAEDAPCADAAVFCPPLVSRSASFLVQLLLYPPEQAEAARAQAREADATAERRGVLALPPDLPHGTRLDLHLEMPGLQVEEPDAALVWTGAATAAQFEVAVPADAPAGNRIGRVRFSIASVPAGTLRFQLGVADAVAPPVAAGPAPVEVQRYRRAFVSYSSADRAEVLRRVQAFRIAGISVFQDVLDLEPGQRWERELYREIDRCDVLLLFWSRAAAASPWVAMEIDYALARKQGREDDPPVIAPVPIEGPPIAPPPERLKHLHFNDALLPHIAAAQAATGASAPGAARPA